VIAPGTAANTACRCLSIVPFPVTDNNDCINVASFISKSVSAADIILMADKGGTFYKEFVLLLNN
jgi:hypothetical protein